MSDDKRYNTRLWRVTRSQVLERDGYLCQIQGKACVGEATQVDHVVRPADGGDFFETGNLRAACGPCNAARGGTVGAQIRNKTSYPPPLEW